MPRLGTCRLQIAYQKSPNTLKNNELLIILLLNFLVTDEPFEHPQELCFWLWRDPDALRLRGTRFLNKAHLDPTQLCSTALTMAPTVERYQNKRMF